MFEAVERLLITLISTNFTFPAYCLASSSRTGPKVRSGLTRSMEVYEAPGRGVKHFSAKRVVGQPSMGASETHETNLWALHFPQTARSPHRFFRHTILRPAPGTPTDDTAFAHCSATSTMTRNETICNLQHRSLLLSVNGWSGEWLERRVAGAARHKMQSSGLSPHQQPSDERYQPSVGEARTRLSDNVSVRYVFFLFLVLTSGTVIAYL